MRLEEALFLARDRERLATPWLPGMRVLWGAPDDPRPPRPGRVLLSDHTHVGWVQWEGSPYDWPLSWAIKDTRHVWRIDRTDACTVGGLAALAREITKQPRLSCPFLSSSAAWRINELDVESYVSEADAWRHAIYASLGVVSFFDGPERPPG